MVIFRKKKKQVSLGIALGGGGARGVAHIAFLKVLDELGIRPGMITGTSIGALIGALYASGMKAESIEERFRSIKFIDRIRLIDLYWGGKEGLIKGRRIHSLLDELTGGRTFGQLEIPLKVVATDFWNSSEVVIGEGPVSDAVRASISIAGVFEPFVIGRKVLIDGGSSNPLPYDILPHSCSIRAAIDVTGVKVPCDDGVELPNIAECMIASFQVLQTSLIESKLRNSKPDLYIKPQLENIGTLDFSKADEILSATEKHAEDFRSELLKHRFV